MALLLAAVVALAGETAPAKACSVDPNYNPLVESDLVVSGYITGFEVARSDDPGESRHPVDFGLRVDRVFAGESPRFIAIRSADPPWDDTLDGFGPVLCFGLRDVDVRRYALFALNRSTDGSLLVGIPLYVGSSPHDEGFQQVVDNLEHPFLPVTEVPGPPDAGTGTGRGSSGAAWCMAGLLLALAGLAGVALSRRATSG